MFELFPTVSQEVRKKAKLAYKEQYISLNETPTQLFEYTSNLLEMLKSHNKVLTVTTGKPVIDLIGFGKRQKHFFSLSRCGIECQSEPHPSMLLELLED